MNHVTVIHCPDSSNLLSPISNSLLRGFTPPLQHKELSVRPGRHPRSRRRQVAIPTGYVCGGWEAECWSNQRQVKTKAWRYFSGVGFQLLNVRVKCFGGEERHSSFLPAKMSVVPAAWTRGSINAFDVVLCTFLPFFMVQKYVIYILFVVFHEIYCKERLQIHAGFCVCRSS